MNNQATQVGGLNRFYGKIYAFLALGIGISAVISYLSLNVWQTQVANFINNFPLGFWGIWIAEIALVIFLGIKAQKNPTLAIGGFIVYSALNGLTLAVTLAMYDLGTVTQAFVTASATFLVMSLVGTFTKRDLSGIGRAALSCLLGIIIAMLLNVFLLHSGAVDFFISILMVVIMSGITAYDNQMIRKVYLGSNGQVGSGVAVFMALQLYLDFINLFISFLRIFGNSK
ncbi:Bax inhibitor-1/YccA family protein [Enterococcus pseudoavium]|uniref:Bax inhibitor-1/YccA family protein n=1 Tax=Enterococcus pseudoavium TaxID=44007 RepID=A0ABU3FID5_9ENTE|nr:Bax inhibitor-1/YccA family protein [Enterococcus pseudoavium]MDT2755092.1 Bax inhibitor-1/YccA family protein [Enterococcus pseudoavium]MDT2770827.1 Bax inhibitor-1/YccA family protein [Enterococcus pseudoavium]REC31842.1 BAX inhibitor (BI)-1/YccA family protein [Enterococcus pseudoavium]